MSRTRTALAAAMCGIMTLSSAIPAVAQIYTWTDAQGRRQVSDRPPEGDVKDLAVKGRAPSGPVSTPTSVTQPKGDDRKGQSLNEKALEFNKRQLDRDESRAKQEKNDAEARERTQRCEQATGYVRNLQNGGRATRIDSKTGERIFLDDKEREKELAEAQRSADSWCKAPPPPPANSTQVSPPK